MTTDSPPLFSLPESLSPRLAWMREQGIKVLFDPSQSEEKPYVARRWDTTEEQSIARAARAATEEEAVVTLATELGLKMWNE